MEDKEKSRNLESQYRLIVDSLADYVHLVDRELRVILINPAFKQWIEKLGFNTDVIGKKITEVFPFLPATVQDEYDEVFKTGKPLITEEKNKVDNREIVTEVRKIPVLEASKAVSVITIVRDITEHKKTDDSLRSARQELEMRVQKRTSELSRVNVELQTQVAVCENKGQELKQAKERAELLYNLVPSAIFAVDKKRRITSWNNKAAELTGYSAEEVMGKECVIFAEVPCKERCGLYDDNVRKPIFGKECVIKRKDGQLRTIIKNADYLKDANGNIIGGIESFEDVTGRKNEEKELSKYREHLEELVKDRTSKLEEVNKQLQEEASKRKGSEDTLFSMNRRLEDIIEFLPDATFVIDKDSKVIAWNRAIEEMTGIKKIDMLGKGDYAYGAAFYGKPRPSLIDLLGKPDRVCGLKYDFIAQKGNSIFAETFHPKIFGGKGGYAWVTASPLFDIHGNKIGAIESIRDITERKKAEMKFKTLYEEIKRTNIKLKRLSLRDSQTGLYNHRYLTEVIEVEFERAKRNSEPISLMMVDIDYFKSINDVYGHQFGDLVLKQFAAQLKKIIRQYDIAVRYGGEEFVIISPGINRSGALKLAQRILDKINFFDFGDKKRVVKLKLSIGVVSYPDDDILNGVRLLELADEILNRVKMAGGNRVYSSLDVRPEAEKGLLYESPDSAILKEKIEKLTKRANQSLIEAVFAFAKTLELKDHYTGKHVEDTVRYAAEVAKALNLSRYEIELIRQAAILHDLGKIGVSEKILLKKAKLTKKEFEQIKKHPQIAVDILRPIQFLHSILPFILHHHERWDGKGYPNGLKGEMIPMGARILAIADAYQALTSDRPYRKAYSVNKAVEIIKKNSGGQFDPAVVKAFLKILGKKG